MPTNIKNLNKELLSEKLEKTDQEQTLQDINDAIEKLVKIRNNIKLKLEKN